MGKTGIKAAPQRAGDVDRAVFDAFLTKRRGNEPEWLTRVREDAFARFTEYGYPGRRDEEWKYTDVGPILETKFGAPPRADKEALIPWVDILGLEDTTRIVLANGRLEPEISAVNELPEGLVVRSLREAIDAGDERVKALLESARPAEDAFSSQNSAFLDDGIVLEVKDNTALERPVELLNLATTTAAAYSVRSRVLVLVGERSQMTLVETYAACRDDEVYFNNVVFDAELKDGAYLDHVKIDDQSRSATQFATGRVTVGRDGLYASNVVSFGGRLVRNYLNVVLAREGAHCDLYGLYSLAGRQQVENRTTIDHAVANTTSREHYKGLLDGQSVGVFCGRILVREDAQKIGSVQENNNLLLSDDARVNSMPQLEIYADDVQCRHGSTIGQIDENMLFYIRSRGIDRQSARGLLTYAFANEIIDTIKIESLRDRLSRRLIAGPRETEGTES